MLGFWWYLQARRERRAVNERSAISDPAGLVMSDAKLRRLCSSLYPFSGPEGYLRCCYGNGLARRFYIQDMLGHGDRRAAVVMTVSPLRVACYCNDLDGVCLLRFPDELAEKHALTPGTHLLTVLNSARLSRPAGPGDVARDIVQGGNANPYCVDFWPLVAEFLSADHDAVAEQRRQIRPEEYTRCRELGEVHLRRLGGAAREGRPDRSMWPVGRSGSAYW